MWNQCLPCSLELIADDELTGPSKRASKQATSERPEDARTHASHASSGSKDTRMPTLQPLPTLLLPPALPATSPSPSRAAALEQVHHSVSHKCCVIFAFSLLLPGALSSNLHSKNTRDDISLATLLHPLPLLPTLPPHLPHSEYSPLSFATAFCLLFAARPLRTLKCIFYGNFKCSFSPCPSPLLCLTISAACPAIINVRKCIVYVA